MVGVGRASNCPSESHPDSVVVLDEVKDFGYIGTIIRTCQAFGVQEVIGPEFERQADPFLLPLMDAGLVKSGKELVPSYHG